MTYKQIETMREIRLWVGQIIVPAATVAATVMAVPETRKAVTTKVKKIKNSITNKFKKKEKKHTLYIVKD